MGTISGIISIISAVIQLVKLFGMIKTLNFLRDVEKGTTEMKNAQTPEAKGAAAAKMVDLIARMHS